MWTAEQKRLLMELGQKGHINKDDARKVGIGYLWCREMFQALQQQEILGKPVVVVENGIQITRYPPAWARGVYPSKSAGSTGRS